MEAVSTELHRMEHLRMFKLDYNRSPPNKSAKRLGSRVESIRTESDADHPSRAARGRLFRQDGTLILSLRIDQSSEATIF